MRRVPYGGTANGDCAVRAIVGAGAASSARDRDRPKVSPNRAEP